MRALMLSMAVLVVSGAGFGAPVARDDARVAALSGADEAVRTKAAQELVAAGVDAVPALVAAMDSDHLVQREMAYKTAQRIVQEGADTHERSALEKVLMEELKAQHRVETRRGVVHMLSVVGVERSCVELVAGLVGDAELSAAARAALVQMRGSYATEALVGLLRKSEGEAKITVINDLKERCQEGAVPALVECTRSDDAAVSPEAWRALASIPSRDSMDAFREATKKKDAAAMDCLVDYALTLAQRTLIQQAEQVVALRQQGEPLTEAERCTLVMVQARLRTSAAIDAVMAALDDPSERVRLAAAAACADLPGTETTQAIAHKMMTAKGSTKMALLGALGRRGKLMDDRAVMLMYTAMLDPDEQVRVACIKATQAAGITATVPTLINIARGRAGAARDAAEEALAHLAGEDVTRQIAEAAGLVPAAEGKPMPAVADDVRVRFAALLGARGDALALGFLRRAATQLGSPVQEAAIRALGKAKASDAYELLVAAFGSERPSIREAAEEAMGHLDDELTTVRLLTDYWRASDNRRPSILRVLARRQFDGITALLLSEAKGHNAVLQLAAVQGLAMRAEPATRDALLQAVESESADIKAAALQGCAAIAGKLEASDPAAAASLYTKVVGEAAELPESHKAQAVEMLQQVLAATKDADVKKRATDQLRELGADIGASH